MKDATYIYSLEHPVTNDVRYIGKSIVPDERFKKHLKGDKSNPHKNNWVNSILKQNLKPVQNIIDIVNTSDYEFWEKHYISLYRSWGFNLLNLTNGGEGKSGFCSTDETKYKIHLKNFGRRYKQKREICAKCQREYSVTIITAFHNDKCTAEERICKNEDCKKSFHVSKSTNTQQYCSRACLTKKRLIRVCLNKNCNKQFETTNFLNRYYCSLQCARTKSKKGIVQPRASCLICKQEASVQILARYHQHNISYT